MYDSRLLTNFNDVTLLPVNVQSPRVFFLSFLKDEAPLRIFYPSLTQGSNGFSILAYNSLFTFSQKNLSYT